MIIIITKPIFEGFPWARHWITQLLDKTFHLVLITITVIISHLYKVQIETLEELTYLTNLHGYWVAEGALDSRAEFQAYFYFQFKGLNSFLTFIINYLLYLLRIIKTYYSPNKKVRNI